MLASHLSGHCGVISNRLWRHQQNVNRASGRVDVTWHNEFINNDKNDDVHHRFLSSFIDSLCRVSYKIKYVLSWRTAHALTRVSFPSRERINSSPLDYKSMHYIYIYMYILDVEDYHLCGWQLVNYVWKGLAEMCHVSLLSSNFFMVTSP